MVRSCPSTSCTISFCRGSWVRCQPIRGLPLHCTFPHRKLSMSLCLEDFYLPLTSFHIPCTVSFGLGSLDLFISTCDNPCHSPCTITFHPGTCGGGGGEDVFYLSETCHNSTLSPPLPPMAWPSNRTWLHCPPPSHIWYIYIRPCNKYETLQEPTPPAPEIFEQKVVGACLRPCNRPLQPCITQVFTPPALKVWNYHHSNQ